MDSVLIEEWLGDSERIDVLDEASVSAVREEVRHAGARLGLSNTVVGALVNVASELGHNQLAHARRGSVVVRAIARDGVPGLEIVAADCGEGIADPVTALRGAPPATSRPGASLGVGLAAVLELADEVDFDIRLHEGTCIWARKFAAAVPRRREVGIYGRPFPGELVSGDHGAFVREGDSLLVGIADGLGHGPQARAASTPAIDTLRERRNLSVDRVLEECHLNIAGTRGAVMAVARIPEPGETVETSCVGNVSAHLYGLDRSRRIMGPSFVLGSPGRIRKPSREDFSLSARDVVALFSDGLTTRTDLEGDLALLREHPIVIAQELVRRFGRDNDDVLVLVAR